MSTESMRIAILGLTVTSSWGNGHASTYRGLIAALDARGHEVVFLERDVPWYRDNRDLHDPPFCRVELYDDLDELRTTHAETVEAADAVIVGSYVPDGVDVADWVLERAGGPVAFYDIDTRVTLTKLEEGDEEYLSADLIPAFDLYLSFAGGRALEILEGDYGAERARTLPCAVDPDQYHPVETDTRWALGYLGTYSDDRQPRVEELLCAPARRLSDAAFVVAGPQYPDRLEWPTNVRRIDHLPPPEHAHFYSAQRWTLNITRDDMRRLGHSPSVRLFEAAARADVPVPASGLLPRRGRRVSDVGRRSGPPASRPSGAISRTRLAYARAARSRAGTSSRGGVMKTLQSPGDEADGPLADQVASLGPWFHNLHLPDGTETAPDHPLGDFPQRVWAKFADELP
ncbi:MAG: hypothetical protein ABEK29_08225, partial [Bradymonadaceae bacterium]